MRGHKEALMDLVFNGKATGTQRINEEVPGRNPVVVRADTELTLMAGSQ